MLYRAVSHGLLKQKKWFLRKPFRKAKVVFQLEVLLVSVVKLVWQVTSTVFLRITRSCSSSPECSFCTNFCSQWLSPSVGHFFHIFHYLECWIWRLVPCYTFILNYILDLQKCKPPHLLLKSQGAMGVHHPKQSSNCAADFTLSWFLSVVYQIINVSVGCLWIHDSSTC